MSTNRFLLLLFYFFICIYTYGQNGPGGVGTTDGSSTLELWLKADTGVEEAAADDAETGDNVAFWRDLSGNSNDFSNDYGSAPTFNLSNGRYVVDFSSGSAYLRSNSFFSGTGARTVIIVTQPTALINAGNNCAFQLAPNEATGKGYTICIEQPGGSFGLACRVSGNRVMDYTTSTSIPTILSIQNGATENVTGTDFYANGTAITTQVSSSAASLNTSNLGSIIGGFSTGADNIPESTYDYNGNISEIIVYSHELSNAERNAVESYLNIKYGITIPVTSHNYYNHSSFPDDIAGLGKESTQNFTKDSAWSVNSSSILSIYNPSSLDDGDYLIWGHDGGSTYYSYTNIPPTINFRTERIWKVSETGETGDVDLKFYIPNLRNCGTPLNSSDIELLIDNIDTDFTDATTHTATSYSNDTIYFSGINLSNNDHFTIGIKNLDRPGDINDNLVLWLKSDCGVEEAINDVAEIGDPVLNWLDQSGLGNDLTNDYGGAPDYSLIGGIPVIDFSSGSSYLRGSSVLSGNTARTMIVVAQPTSLTANTANNCAFILAPNNTAGTGYGLFFEAPGAASGLAIRVSGNRIMDYTTSTTSPTLIQTSGAAGINVSATNFYANGELITQEVSLGDVSLNTNSLGIMAGGFSNDGDMIPESIYDFNGYLHEIIVFDRELTCPERKQIEIYLADKYGITLDYFDETVSGSNGIENDVEGILKKFGAFADVTSASTGGLDINDITFLNEAGDAYYIGHNGALGITSSDIPGGIDSRLSRIWFGDYSSCNGNTGNITLSFDLAGLDCASETPANAANYRLLISATNSFSGATLISGASINAGAIEFTIDISQVSDLFFTLATIDESTSSLWYPTSSPANISNGLQLWLKADCGVEEAPSDAAESGDDVAFWRDLSGNGNDVSNDYGTAPVLNDVAGVKSVDFSNGSSYLRGNSVITGTTGRTVFTVLNSNSLSVGSGNAVFSLAPNVTSGTGYAIALESPSGTNGLAVRVSGNKVMNHTVSTGTPVIISTQSDNNENVTDTEFFVDGASITSLQSSGAAALNTDNQGIILGGWSTDGDLIPDNTWDFDGEIMEIIVYDRELSCDERKQIETYLANKYNITLQYEEVENIGDNGIINDITFIEESTTTLTSSALTLSDVSYLTDCIDTLWVAHDNQSGVTAKADDPDMIGLVGTDVNRWTRIWYALIVSNDLNIGNVSLTFDLDDYPSNATVSGSDYRLITSASPWTYASTISGPTLNVGNNTVSFVVDVDEINKKKFTLATINEGVSPLPVTLLNFSVKPNKTKVNLNWTTLTEINNDYFTVEKSSNLKEWNEVGKIKGAGNSSTSIVYQTTDDSPKQGINYYRLKQTDFDGKYSYSGIEEIIFNSETSIKLYPNVFSDYFIIEEEDIDLSDIQIFNLVGQNITNLININPSGNHKLIINASKLSSGIYLVNIDNQTFKINKQ